VFRGRHEEDIFTVLESKPPKSISSSSCA
jgi:hypothetical protein